MKLLVLLSMTLSLTLTFSPLQPHERDFRELMFKYRKSYATEEEYLARFASFIENLNLIESHSEEVDYVLELNQFFDLTPSEFESQILMAPKSPINFKQENNINFRDTLPDSFDWRQFGAVTPVKDQGSVGSCWAFSTTGNIEGQNYLKTGILVSLSEEQLVDCDGTSAPAQNEADCGVFGGWPDLAYQYVIGSNGLLTEEDYPYCVGTGACYPCKPENYNEKYCGQYTSYCNASYVKQCNNQFDRPSVQIQDWQQFSQDENEIAASLILNGPMSVLINAQGLQFYKSGIFNPKHCNPQSLDHAVLLVGYGTENGQDYWIVKNSWGVKWGESGYFRITRGVGMCGINTHVTSAIIESIDIVQ